MARTTHIRKSTVTTRFVKACLDDVRRLYGDHPDVKIQAYAQDGFFIRVPGYYLSMRKKGATQVVLGMNETQLTRHVDYADELADTLMDFLAAETEVEAVE